MNHGWPAVEQERLLAAAEQAHVRLTERPWIRSRLFTRIAFFILTLMGVSAFFGLISLVADYHAGFWMLAIVAGVAGELLIHGKRMFGAGPEEALWITCTLAVLASVLDGLRSLDVVTICILAALAFFVAGLRVLNPIFTTCAWIALLPMIIDKQSKEVAAAYCIVVAVAALAVYLVELRRPSLNAMLEWLFCVMPAIAYLCVTLNSWLAPYSAFRPGIAALFLLLVAAFVYAGLRRRLHAPLFAAMPCVVIVAYECRHLTGLSLEMRLILWGALLFVVAFVAERLLHGRASGITSDAVETGGNADLLGLAGAAAAGLQVHQPGPASPAAEPSPQGGGGEFGGAGASGDY
jgi:hypothetical protein